MNTASPEKVTRTERPVRFPCCDETAVGILHSPTAPFLPGRRVGIVFNFAGLRYRIGPYRIFVRLARRLCEAGVYVLRYDIPGMGDTPGCLRDTEEFRRKVVNNTAASRCAVDFFRDETGVDSIGLSGLCGGAMNALLSGAADARTDFLLLLSLPVMPLGDLSETSFARTYARGYLRKLFQWQAWKKLLSLRSRFDLMCKAVGQLLRFRVRTSDVDPALWESFDAFIGRDKHVLLVFGEKDEAYPHFQKAFAPLLKRLRPPQNARYELSVISRANHVYSQLAWQHDVADRVLEWLKRVLTSDDRSQTTAGEHPEG